MKKLFAVLVFSLLTTLASAQTKTKITSTAIQNSSVDSTPIGDTSPSRGRFTTMEVTGPSCPKGQVAVPPLTSSSFQQLYGDDFSRADGALTGSGAWAAVGSSTGLNVSGGAIVAGANNSRNLWAAAASTEQWASVQYQTFALPCLGDCESGVHVRESVDGASYYYLSAFYSGEPLQWGWVKNGSKHMCGYATAASGDEIKLSVTGQGTTTVTAYKNGAVLGSCTDSTSPILTGYYGLIDSPGLTLAHWKAGTVNSTAGTVCVPDGQTPGSFTTLAAGKTVTAQNYAQFSAAITSIGSSKGTIVVNGTVTINTSVTVPVNIGVEVMPGGQFNGSGTLTLNGPFSTSVFLIKAFDPALTVHLNAVSDVYPAWFGATCDSSGGSETDDLPAFTAMEAAISGGVMVHMPATENYPIPPGKYCAFSDTHVIRRTGAKYQGYINTLGGASSAVRLMSGVTNKPIMTFYGDYGTDDPNPTIEGIYFWGDSYNENSTVDGVKIVADSLGNADATLSHNFFWQIRTPIWVNGRNLDAFENTASSTMEFLSQAAGTGQMRGYKVINNRFESVGSLTCSANITGSISSFSNGASSIQVIGNDEITGKYTNFVAVNNAQNLIITGNNRSNALGTLARLQGTTTGADISGNATTSATPTCGTDQMGVWANTMKYANVGPNSFRGLQMEGVKVTAEIDASTIHDNVLHNTSLASPGTYAAISVGSAGVSGGVLNNIIDCDTASNCHKYGVDGTDSQSFVIRGNSVHNSAVSNYHSNDGFTPLPGPFGWGGGVVIPSSSDIASIRGSVVTTASISDSITMTGVSTASYCTYAPMNAAAGSLMLSPGGVYLTVGTNQVTVNHANDRVGSIFHVMCSVN